MGQMSLRFGANDFGGTMIEENVVSAAGCSPRVGPDRRAPRVGAGSRRASATPGTGSSRAAEAGLPRLPRRGRHPRRGARGRGGPDEPGGSSRTPRPRHRHRGKVFEGTRLSRDGVRLYGADSAVGALANWMREDRHGDLTYFNVNQHVNYTNVCNKLCRFCAFQRLPPGGRLRDEARGGRREDPRAAGRAGDRGAHGGRDLSSCPTSTTSTSSAR